MNIQNIREFSRGIWRQSKVRQKPAPSKPAPSKPAPSKPGGKKSPKAGPKRLESGKLTKGNSNVGKNSPKLSPKNRRKRSVSSTGSLNNPTIALANTTLKQKKDWDLPSEMMSGSWSRFSDDDVAVFHAYDAKLFENLLSGTDAEMMPCDEELENALVDGDYGYDSPAAAAIAGSPTKPLNSWGAGRGGTTPCIISEVDGCFALPDGLAKLGSGITTTESFDDLVSDFSHIKVSPGPRP